MHASLDDDWRNYYSAKAEELKKELNHQRRIDQALKGDNMTKAQVRETTRSKRSAWGTFWNNTRELWRNTIEFLPEYYPNDPLGWQKKLQHQIMLSGTPWFYTRGNFHVEPDKKSWPYHYDIILG